MYHRVTLDQPALHDLAAGDRVVVTTKYYQKFGTVVRPASSISPALVLLDDELNPRHIHGRRVNGRMRHLDILERLAEIR